MHTAQAVQTPHAGTAIGAVRLAVRDRARVADFYRNAIGLETLPGTDDGTVLRLGTGRRTLVELVSAPDAHPAPRNASGLYHLAVLVPDRAALAAAIARVSAANARFQGAADHLVSEAIYLADPEGNGIEIYRDRPRAEWRYRDQQLEMATLPLDLDGVMSDLPDGPVSAHVPGDTRIGPIHLRVDDLAAARRFHVGVLGLDATVDGLPGALFVSAQGYHHHIGLNTWTSRQPAPSGCLGLVDYELIVPDAATRRAIAERSGADGSGLRDPAGNHPRITVG